MCGPLQKRFRALGRLSAIAPLLAAVLALTPAHASITILVGEPYGSFGTMMPVGHAAIYLDHLCAAGPLALRQCQPGEPQGVVLARYHQLGGLDWVATPILQFLYAVDRPEQIPAYATPEIVWDLRQSWRRQYLTGIVPDGEEKAKSTNEWQETAGAAYDRRLWGYQLDTTPAQDTAFLAHINAIPNHHLYHLRKTNCADFAADAINFYYPGTVRSPDHIADFGVMSPKQVGRSVESYGEAHPELHLRVLEVAQAPGSLRRSRPLRGGAEALLKTKRYLATLLLIQPEVPAALAILYLAHGRWQIGKDAEIEGPEAFEAPGQSVPATQ